jgi:uncharacterized protein YneF (UPF0154 family)
MSQPNPYLAPQAALSGGGVPMANASLPRELLVVSDGLKFVLWSIIIMVVAIVVGLVLGSMAAAKIIQAAAAQQGNLTPEEAVAIMMQPILVTAGIMFLADLVRIFGLFKCSQIPVESGAKAPAQLALYSAIAVLLIGIINNVLAYRSADVANPSGLVKVIGLIGMALWLTTLFSFLTFLKKTAAYLGDALSIERANKLFTLSAIVGVCVAISQVMTLIGSNAQVGMQAAAGGGMLMVILGLVMLVCGIWAFFVYLGTLTRMRSVIENGVR